MNILILYHSRTHHTQKLAYEIAKGAESVSGSSVILKTTEEVSKEDFLTADALIAGSPVYFGTMAAELKKVFDDFVGLRKKMENKIGAAFSTSGYHTGGKETTLMSIIQALLIYGMIIAGDPMSASGHYGAAFSGDMDETMTRYACRFGERISRIAAATQELR